MNTRIVVEIQPHEDGVRCGECKVKVGVRLGTLCNWAEHREVGEIFDVGMGQKFRRQEEFRGPECLAAEAKLRALVEAEGLLRRLRNAVQDQTPRIERSVNLHMVMIAACKHLAALEDKP